MLNRAKVFLLLFTGIALSNQQYLMASESAGSLFPTLKNKSTNSATGSNYDGRLSAYSFYGNVSGSANSWRSAIESQADQSINIDLKTGNWNRGGSSEKATVWVSYDLDWAPITASGKTITYSYTFGESTIGVSSSFRLIASGESRYDGHISDCALILNYGEKDCTFYLNGKTSTGKLADPIVDGTKVKVTLHPNNTLSIQIDNTPIIADQQLTYDENYIVFSASSEARPNPSLPRQLALRNVTVEAY